MPFGSFRINTMGKRRMASGPVYEYNIAGAQYTNKSFSVSAQGTGTRDIYIKPDGSGYFTLRTANDNVSEYAMSTPWDVSTSSYVKQSTSMVNYSYYGLTFKSDGTAFYATANNGHVLYYSLSTPWDVTTKTLVSDTLINNRGTNIRSIKLSSDGTKLYLQIYNEIAQYTCSTPWDPASYSYDGNFFFPTGNLSGDGLDFTPDGTRVYLADTSLDSITEAELSTPWDVRTASVTGNEFWLGNQDANPAGISFGNDGKVLFMCGATNNRVYQYSTEIANGTNLYPTATVRLYAGNSASYLSLSGNGMDSLSSSSILSTANGMSITEDNFSSYAWMRVTKLKTYKFTIVNNQLYGANNCSLGVSTGTAPPTQLPSTSNTGFTLLSGNASGGTKTDNGTKFIHYQADGGAVRWYNTGNPCTIQYSGRFGVQGYIDLKIEQLN